MHLVIKGCDRNRHEAIRAFVKGRVISKLSRVSKRLRSIQIWIRDINGPRGGKDHVIQLIVQLKPTGNVVIRHRDYDPYAGIRTALKRSLSAVKRALRRRRSNRIDSYRRNLRYSGIRSKHIDRVVKTIPFNQASTSSLR